MSTHDRQSGVLSVKQSEQDGLPIVTLTIVSRGVCTEIDLLPSAARALWIGLRKPKAVNAFEGCFHVVGEIRNEVSRPVSMWAFVALGIFLGALFNYIT